MSEIGERSGVKIAGHQRTPPSSKGRFGQALGAIGGFLRGETEPNPKSPQLWDVRHTLQERSGLDTNQRSILKDAWEMFLSKVREKGLGYEWNLKTTPQEFQDTEYSLLTLFCLEWFLPDVENGLIQELNNPGPRSAWNFAGQEPKDIRQMTNEVKAAIQQKAKWLWKEQFCQRNSVDPESPSAQEHRQLIQQKANVLSSLLHRSEDNPNEVHKAIGDAFEGIEASRLQLLPPNTPVDLPLLSVK